MPAMVSRRWPAGGFLLPGPRDAVPRLRSPGMRSPGWRSPGWAGHAACRAAGSGGGREAAGAAGQPDQVASPERRPPALGL